MDQPNPKVVFVPNGDVRSYLPGPIIAALKNLDKRAAESQTVVAVVMLISAHGENETQTTILASAMTQHPLIGELIRQSLMEWFEKQKAQKNGVSE